MCTYRLCRLRLIQGHGMLDGRIDPLEIARPRDGSDHRRAAPGRELGRKRAHPAEHALDQDRLAVDWAVSEQTTMGGNAGDPETRSRLVADLIG